MKKLSNIVLLIVILLISCLISGCGSDSDVFDITDTEDEYSDELPSEQQMFDADAAKGESPSVIVVHVCGQVKNPGVYELLSDSRVYQAINAAGGLCVDANAALINQAEPLCDGQMIYVPSVKESTNEVNMTATSKTPGNATNSEVININTATQAELESIKGIGSTRALSIIEYRDKNGRFMSTEDITKVSGIGSSTYEKIKDNIRVN